MCLRVLKGVHSHLRRLDLLKSLYPTVRPPSDMDNSIPPLPFGDLNGGLHGIVRPNCSVLLPDASPHSIASNLILF